MNSLSEVIAPKSIDAFITEVVGNDYMLQHGIADRYASLMPWDMFSKIIEQHQPDRIKLVKNGANVPPSLYMDHFLRRSEKVPIIRAQAVINQLRSGATVVVNGIEDLYQPLRVLVTDMERKVGERISVNAYVGFGETQGFDLHWDDHDVLILQIHGKKAWKVYGMSRPHPLQQDRSLNFSPPKSPIWSGELVAGSLLYLPRGWWHVATPMSEPSLHLTFGFGSKNRTGVDLVHWIGDQLHELDYFRADIPRFASAERKAAYIDKLRSDITKLLTPDVIDKFICLWDGNAVGRTHISVPWQVSGENLPLHDNFEIHSVAPRAIRFSREGNSSTISIRTMGKMMSFASEEESAVSNIVGCIYKPFLQLLEECHPTSQTQIRALLSTLAANGVIIIKMTK